MSNDIVTIVWLNGRASVFGTEGWGFEPPGDLKNTFFLVNFWKSSLNFGFVELWDDDVCMTSTSMSEDLRGETNKRWILFVGGKRVCLVQRTTHWKALCVYTTEKDV
jgi:hypothetical protein